MRNYREQMVVEYSEIAIALLDWADNCECTDSAGRWLMDYNQIFDLAAIATLRVTRGITALTSDKAVPDLAKLTIPVHSCECDYQSDGGEVLDALASFRTKYNF